MNNVVDPILRVTEKYRRVFIEEQRVLHTGIARRHGALEHDHVIGVPDPQHRLAAQQRLAPIECVNGDPDTKDFAHGVGPGSKTTILPSDDLVVIEGLSLWGR